MAILFVDCDRLHDFPTHRLVNSESICRGIFTSSSQQHQPTTMCMKEASLTLLLHTRFVFAKVNLKWLNNIVIELSNLLKRNFKDTGEKAAVVVDANTPMVWKFTKVKECLDVQFNYGYWNRHGFPHLVSKTKT